MTVTLDTLREEFETNAAIVVEYYRPKPIQLLSYQVDVIALPMQFTPFWTTPDGFIAAYEEGNHNGDGLCGGGMFYQGWDHVRPTYEAAKLYCIARDEGISAAVMWRLQDASTL